MAPQRHKTIWEVEYLLKLLEARVYGYRSKRDIEMWDNTKAKLMWLKDWANSGDRWHDFGHVFLGFFVTAMLATTGVWWLGGAVTAVYALIKEFLIDGYCGKDNWMDLFQYAIGIGLGYLCVLSLI